MPKGVFSLPGAGNKCSSTVLADPNVDGVSLRQDWADLEPSEGNFDFSFLDSEVARVAGAGKQVLLRINTQFSKPAWVTEAVIAAGGSFFTFDKQGVANTIPVFWDPTFLAKKKAMITALGAHFTSNPAIVIVWSSFANAASEDWNVPHEPDEVTQWLALGYTSEKLIDAGQQIIETTMNAFPNQFVTLAVGSDGTLDSETDANYVARTVVLWARAMWPGRLVVQKNSLSAYTPEAPGLRTGMQLLWDSQPDVAGQMLWNCFGDTTYRMNNGVAADPAVVLHESVDIGHGYGMNFIEIYQTDVVGLPSEIAYAHDLLVGSSSSELPPNVPAAPTGLYIVP